MNSQERQEALERACRGDHIALGHLLESFRPYVRVVVGEFCSERWQGQADASDFVQNAFVEVQRSFAGFHGTTVAEFVGWLRRLALRHAWNTAQEHERTPPRAEDGPLLLEQATASGSSPSARAMRQELVERITEALAHLPPTMQQVLQGRLVDDLSHRELAERLGRSEGAVRILYVRALARLRELYFSS